MSQTAANDEKRRGVRTVLTGVERRARYDTVMDLVRNGMFINEACEAAGVPRSWLYKWKRRSDGGCEDQREVTRADREWINTLLNEGMTQTAVAKEVQVSRASVRKIVRQRKKEYEDQRRRMNEQGFERTNGDLRLESISSSESANDSSTGDKNTLRAETDADAQKPIPPTMSSSALIGPAGELERSVHFKEGPVVVLFHGPPGVGKSALCTKLAQRLVPPEHIERVVGTDCTVDKLRELTASLHTRPMFAQWHVLIIEEADKIPSVAQVSILHLFDQLPKHCAVLATSNADKSGFTARLWTRFERHELKGPQNDEVANLLSEKVPKKQREAIAARTGGNVRDALKEAQAWCRINLSGAAKTKKSAPTQSEEA